MTVPKITKSELSKKREEKLLKKKEKQTKHYLVNEYLSKAGISIESNQLSKSIFKAALILTLIVTFYFIFFFAIKQGYTLSYIFIVLFIVWALAFFLFLGLIWLGFYLFLDIRIFKRKLSIEEVLPDFLQLTATNIRSGMTVDKALWFAVRPRFGVLAKEIEIVAKEVMSGMELTDSLQKFATKYESDTLKRSINLLIEGIKSGGEIGDLLMRIANNIQESKLMKEEMSADVTTYVMFITFAAVVAAPILLALSGQLILVIEDIVSKLDAPSVGDTMFALTSLSVTPSDFKIFAYASLIVTSFFSSIIVATIKKGNIKEGFKYIPFFILTSIIIFLFASKILNALLSGVIL